ncbi:hypothetical protein BH10BAC2_BH10BAC2_27560 [soil metagenome]
MTSKHFQLRLLQPIVLSTFLSAIFSYSSFAGGDHYEIYLNKKLVSKQSVTSNIAALNLQLDKSNYHDEITIYYSHCGVTGKERSLVLKDEKGRILKEWKFDDGKNTVAMTIPAKDIISLKMKSSGMMLFYTAKELPKGRILTSLNLNNKNTVSYQYPRAVDETGIALVQHFFIRPVNI